MEESLEDSDANPRAHLIQIKAAIAPVKGIPRVSHSPTEIRYRFKTKVQAEDYGRTFLRG